MLCITRRLKNFMWWKRPSKPPPATWGSCGGHFTQAQAKYLTDDLRRHGEEVWFKGSSLCEWAKTQLHKKEEGK